MDADWTDAHAHPHQLTDPDAAWERAWSLGVRRVWAQSTSPEDWDDVEAGARTRRGWIPFFGVHPWNAASVSGDWGARLAERLLRTPRAGVGEIGVDTRLTDTPVARQQEVLREQIRIANRLHRPCALHVVGAWPELFEVLKEEAPERMLLHAFGGSPEQVRAFAKRPTWFSFGGAVIRQSNSTKLREAVRAVPDDRLLLETDAPYQHPDDKDAEQEPAGLLRIAEAVARLRGVPVDRLRRRVEANAERFLHGFR